MKHILASTLLLTTSAGLFAQTAGQIMDQTTRMYASLQSLRFEARSQTVYELRLQGRERRSTTQSTYTVAAARPNRLRLALRERNGATFTALQSDGNTLYIENRRLKQTLRKTAPKTLRELYSQQNLALAGLLLVGVDPLTLMAHGDWRPFASNPKLVGRERVGGRPTHKLTLQLQSTGAFGQLQALGTQTLWIGVQDKLIWKSEIVLRLSSRGESYVLRYTATILRQERNSKINTTVFNYQLPQGYKLVERFELPSLLAETASLKGKPAQEFALKDLSSKEVRLSDYKGKVVVLNIFAHWCGPCHQEAPKLERDIWQAYRNREVVVLGVAVWAQSEPTKRAAEFAKQHKLTFPVLVDANGTVASSYRVQGVPTTYIIDKQGIIREVVVGADVAAIKRAIEALLQ